MSRKDSLFGNRPGFRDEKSVTSIKDQDVEKIEGLHVSIGANLNNALQNAILIGEILTRKKRELTHGTFIPWIEANLPFSRMTANKYMRLFESKHKLSNVNSGLHLTEALKLLTSNAGEEKEINPKRNTLLIYKDFREGKILSKNEKIALKNWIQTKANNLRKKLESLEKEIKKIK